jgi:hypothetical protein
MSRSVSGDSGFKNGGLQFAKQHFCINYNAGGLEK